MFLLSERSCERFSFDAIQKATEDFHESKVIGTGGFGKVYKGTFDDGSFVAVKRLNPESKQGVREFETEINLLSKFRHCHLVALLGYCNEPPEMILVYEYMSNGTLADHLYKNEHEDHKSPLTWEQRLKICIGAARGLDYLHSGIGLMERVIHLDVKSCNILLDDNWAAKISDMGLSRVGPANQPCSEVITDHVRGTRGYIDPEYRKSHRFSRKADIYAFGVVLLEVLSGTRIFGGEIIPDPEVNDLARWTQNHIRNGTLNEIVDRSIRGEIQQKCLQMYANTASKSLHNDPEKRPTMTEVVAQLETTLACQKGTNPTTSILEDDEVFQHFNAASIQSRLETMPERKSENSEESSKIQDSDSETTTESDDSPIWLSMGITKEEYLGKARNLFGEPITNDTLKQMGTKTTCEDRARVAYSMMNQGNKYDSALHFVKHLKKQFGKGVTTLCLVYNATGETLVYAGSRNWYGDIGPSPYPTVILNGQWGAYLHTKVPWMPGGSVAAVVYRSRYSNSSFCDRMIAWSIPWQRFTQDNTAYCEINEVGYFDGSEWDEIYRKMKYAGRESSIRWKECYTRVNVESDTSPIYKAVLTRVDAVAASV